MIIVKCQSKVHYNGVHTADPQMEGSQCYSGATGETWSRWIATLLLCYAILIIWNGNAKTSLILFECGQSE